MKKFINRTDEITFLEKEYQKTASSLVVLYGRRRTGKTALVSHFGADKSMLYFFATEESEHENMRAFKQLVGETIGSELLLQADVKSWELLFKELIKNRPDERKLIVIDEFQYLGKSNAAFPTIFQKIWDTMLKDANVMVILCGSLISMMESQTLSYSSPLYGRRTGQIKLKPIEFKFYHEFYGTKTREELIDYYSVTGGVPKYIELFEGSADVYSAIEQNVLTSQSFLYEEPLFLLQNEVSEVGTYFSIIKAIAAGNRKLSKISAVLNVKQTNLSRYLKTLIDLEILERQVPVTEEMPEKSKKGLYRIKDHYIEFWFKFIFPNKGTIEMGNTDLVANRIRQNLRDNHTSFVYEDVCIEEMWRLNRNDTWAFHFDRIGRWWDSNTEIDLIAYESGGQDMIFGECKYTELPMDTDVFFRLEEKVKKVPWKHGRREHFVLFSINGHTAQLEALALQRKNILLCR